MFVQDFVSKVIFLVTIEFHGGIVRCLIVREIITPGPPEEEFAYEAFIFSACNVGEAVRNTDQAWLLHYSSLRFQF